MPSERDRGHQLFTRCDHCKAVLPVSHSDLGQAGGMVRCGSCGRTLNALARLYASFPDNATKPIAVTGMPPMLPPYVEQEQILASPEPSGGVDEVADHRRDDSGDNRGQNGGDDCRDDGGDNRGPVLRLDLEPDAAPGWMRLVWPAVGLVLLGLLMLQLAGPEGWRLDPAALGISASTPVAPEDAVQLVSRDMHPHPSLDDAVVISAVMVNRSGRSVPWPNIELELFDASQQTLARRRLAPRDYLSPEANLEAGFSPDVRLPVVLEMAVESSRPSGFSMSFYD